MPGSDVEDRRLSRDLDCSHLVVRDNNPAATRLIDDNSGSRSASPCPLPLCSTEPLGVARSVMAPSPLRGVTDRGLLGELRSPGGEHCAPNQARGVLDRIHFHPCGIECWEHRQKIPDQTPEHHPSHSNYNPLEES